MTDRLERERRQAEALKANLRRRKAQARQKAAGPTVETPLEATETAKNPMAEES